MTSSRPAAVSPQHSPPSDQTVLLLWVLQNMRWESLREMGELREALAVAKDQRKQLKSLFLAAGGGEDELSGHAAELKQMREDAQVEARNACHACDVCAACNACDVCNGRSEGCVSFSTLRRRPSKLVRGGASEREGPLVEQSHVRVTARRR